jgi:hypothetical protein
MVEGLIHHQKRPANHDSRIDRALNFQWELSIVGGDIVLHTIEQYGIQKLIRINWADSK